MTSNMNPHRRIRVPQRSHLPALLLLSLALSPLAWSQVVPIPQRLDKLYYARTCPGVDSLVFDFVRTAVRKEPRLGAMLIRLLFHDCFVKGCEASVLLDGMDENPAEKNASPNLTLGGFEFMDDLKKLVESKCPGAVSCADLLAMSARDSVHLLGGPRAQLRLGRLDGTETSSGDVVGRIPDAAKGIRDILVLFNTLGLNAVDTVALSGAHTVGKGQCNHLQNRIQFPDRSMSPNFRLRLVKQCGTMARFLGVNMVNMDPVSPVRFDNQYYKNLLLRAGTFTSDQSMTLVPGTMRLVRLYAANQTAFFRQFAASFAKMAEIGVLGKPFGEVRTNCRLPLALSGGGNRGAMA